MLAGVLLTLVGLADVVRARTGTDAAPRRVLTTTVIVLLWAAVATVAVLGLGLAVWSVLVTVVLAALWVATTIPVRSGGAPGGRDQALPWLRRSGSWPAVLLAVAVAVLLLYALAKQPLAIATIEQFTATGFVERALLTQACLAGGWLLLRRARFPSLGGVLLTLGLARFVWFDLLLLSPVLVPQQVGGIPLLNAAVLHAAAVAAWAWTLAPARPIRTGAALATLVALLATVRQAAHGSLMTGPVSTAENGGYSAILLGAALFWLWRGISTGARDLRIAGLSLLTVVTFKVFLIDAAALDGVLRILSFLALGIALIGIGWAYSRFLGGHGKTAAPTPDTAVSTSA